MLLTRFSSMVSFVQMWLHPRYIGERHCPHREWMTGFSSNEGLPIFCLKWIRFAAAPVAFAIEQIKHFSSHSSPSFRGDFLRVFSTRELICSKLNELRSCPVATLFSFDRQDRHKPDGRRGSEMLYAAKTCSSIC